MGSLLRWSSRPSVECSDIQDCVLYNLVKSVDTVIETGHHLVEIAEKKIAAMWIVQHLLDSCCLMVIHSPAIVM
jgi:hypothetical protein